MTDPDESTPPVSTTSGVTSPKLPAQPSRVRELLAQAWSAIALPLLAIVLALIVGGVLIVLTSALAPGATLDIGLPFRAYKALIDRALLSPNGRVDALNAAAPLILAGLGVALAFKAGLFNIGGRGQYLLGAVAAVAASLVVGKMDPIIAIPVAVIAGAAAGAAWGFIPGFLKAFTGAHEVVTTIMLNFVADSLVIWLIINPLRRPGPGQPDTPLVGNSALPVILGDKGHLGILLAFAAVPIVWYLLNRLTLGFEIRAVGANPDAARYAGMKPRRLIVLTMSMAGMLAGLAGTIDMLGISHHMQVGYSTTVGFEAITVALLGRTNPIGVMFAALLFGVFRAGAQQMHIVAGVPPELVDILEAVILFFLVISPVLRRVFRLRGVKSGLGTTDTMTRTYGSEAIR